MTDELIDLIIRAKPDSYIGCATREEARAVAEIAQLVCNKHVFARHKFTTMVTGRIIQDLTYNLRYYKQVLLTPAWLAAREEAEGDTAEITMFLEGANDEVARR